jgi:S1-C subfamily serine protease
MLTACGAALTPSPARVSRDKIASIADWGMASMHDLPAGLYVQARSAILVQGANGVVGTGPGQPTGQPVGQPPTAMFWPTLDGAPVTRIQAGMAAAISDDGYWLTAAHCTDPEPLVLVRPTADGRLEHWPARVVWRAPSDGVTNVMDVAPYRDLAILHTRVDAPIPAFTLASSPPISGRVLCMGAGIATTRWSAGRVLGVEPSPAACVTLVRHDAPLFYGDSGGPAVLDDGTLVGVNVERVWGFLIPDWSVAAWLEPRVIRDVIEADRRARSSAEGSGVEGGRVEGGGVEGTGAQGDDAVAAGASRGP